MLPEGASNLTGKKLLILGGAEQHNKLVIAARELGVVSYVADYLSDSPAKALADHGVMIDIFDDEALAAFCSSEEIDGVASGWLDPCQVPYVALCEKLGYPCYGSSGVVRILTNKVEFKACCEAYGVGVIPYECGTPEELMGAAAAVGLPAFVKPAESRGSRGQAICESPDELRTAIREAAKASRDGRALVEKYLDDADDVSVTYFFVGGVPHLERISDRILGRAEDGLSNVAIGSISPSLVAEQYLRSAHEKVVSMLKGIGCQNGPVFMQGFAKDGEFYFYDPGMRFPGGNYELAVAHQLGIDYAKELVRFALTGRMGKLDDDLDRVCFFGGSVEVIHDVTVRPGVIRSIAGLNEVRSLPGVVSVSPRYAEGDEVPSDKNVARRFAEINYVADGVDDALRMSACIQQLVSVRDSLGDDMKISPMDQGIKKWAMRRTFELDV